MADCLVITGASKGIGKATAQFFLAKNRLAKKEWHVINISRSLCELEGVTNVQADLTTSDWHVAVKAQLEQHIQAPEKLIVVHNAAVYFKDSLQTIMPEKLNQMLAVGIVAPARLNQLLIPSMAKGSAILYLGSTLGEKAVANAASYVVTKHAVVGLMRASCQDLAGTGIHTVCVCPGFTATEMMHAHLQENPSLLTTVAQANAFKRLIGPSEIAATLYFCATNPVVNGAVIHANLGQVEV